MDQVKSEILTNPFPGLRPFESHENHLFFGRDGQSNELLRKLRETHFLVVVGTSGSGKSSLVRAGLLPDLYSGMMAGSNSKWRIAIFRPGGDPMENLARALSKPGVLVAPDLNDEDRQLQQHFIRITLGRSTMGLVECMRQADLPKDENLLVVADQFEELFRYMDHSMAVNAHDQATALVKLLLTSVEQTELPIYIVITMRSDYLGDCSRFRDLPEAINEGQYLIPRMTRNQRREAICGPVAVGGAQITPQLVQTLLNDVGSNPDQLPIMQHALMRTWDRWVARGAPDSPIDITDYQAVGGIEHALSWHADKAYEELAADQTGDAGQRRQKIAERMFKFLTEKGPDNREIRRQAALGDISKHIGATLDEVISVVEVFRRPGYSFLMPPRRELTAKTVIDISHESLIRQWETLNKWVDEETESSKIYLRLVESAQLHQEKKKDYLFGLELDQFLNWKEQFKPDLAWAKRYSDDCEKCLKYLEESQQQRQRILEKEEALARLEKIRRKEELKRTRIFALVLAIITMISIGFLYFAIKQKEIANEQKDLALAQRDIAEANYQISQAQSQAETDPTIALRMAQMASSINSSPLILSAAHKIYRENMFYKTFLHNDEVHGVAFAPDNNTFLTGSKDGIARLWDLSGQVLLELRAHQGGVSTVAFSPAGDMFLSGGMDGSAKLWDLKGNLVQNFEHPEAVTAALFSPDGRSVLTAADMGYLWSTEGRLLRRIGQDGISSMAFSPDGSTVAAAFYDRKAGLFDLNGKQLRTIGSDTDYIYAVAFAPNGNTIVTGSVDGVIRIWDRMGVLIREISAHSNWISSVVFAPNGRSILAGSFDNYIRLWDLNGNLLKELKGHRNRISSVAFSSNGKKILSGSYDGTSRVWTRQATLIGEFKGHSQYVFSAAFSPDGSRLVTGSYDQTAKLWSVTGTFLREMNGNAGRIHAVVFSPDGSKILTGLEDQKAILWDAQGNKLRELTGHQDAVASVAFSPSADTILTGSGDRTIRMWSDQGEFLREIGAHEDRVSSVVFSPDGKQILSASWDGKARLWDLQGKLLVQFEGHTDQIHHAIFSPDGRSVLTGSGDGSAKLWDLQGNVLLNIDQQAGIISSVAFSPDGTKMATVALGHYARLWDVNGNLLQEYPGQMCMVNFSPDGQQLIIGNGETGQLWDGVMLLQDFLKDGIIDELESPGITSD